MTVHMHCNSRCRPDRSQDLWSSKDHNSHCTKGARGSLSATKVFRFVSISLMATVPLTLLEVQRLASVVSIPITRSCLNHSRSAISVPLPFHACLDQEKSAAIYKQAEALQSVVAIDPTYNSADIPCVTLPRSQRASCAAQFGLSFINPRAKS